MSEAAGVLLVLYALGVGAGVLLTDEGGAERLGLALLWPLGPLAFGFTLAVLLGASFIAFPLFGAAVLLAAAIAYSVFSV